MGRAHFCTHIWEFSINIQIPNCAITYYADLCSGGTEAVYILSIIKSVCSYTAAVSPEHKSACSYTASVPSEHKSTCIHKFSSSPSTSLHVHSCMLECAVEIHKCGAEMCLCP